MVRVRSVQLKDKTAELIEGEPIACNMEMQTNILTFQPFMRLYKEITESVIDDLLLESLIN